MIDRIRIIQIRNSNHNLRWFSKGSFTALGPTWKGRKPDGDGHQSQRFAVHIDHPRLLLEHPQKYNYFFPPIW